MSSRPSVDAEWRAELIDVLNELAIAGRDREIDPKVEMSPGTAIVLGKLAAKIIQALIERRKAGTRNLTSEADWLEDALHFLVTIIGPLSGPALKPLPIPLPPIPPPPPKPPELVP
jgi:hypothetical protein